MWVGIWELGGTGGVWELGGMGRMGYYEGRRGGLWEFRGRTLELGGREDYGIMRDVDCLGIMNEGERHWEL